MFAVACALTAWRSGAPSPMAIAHDPAPRTEIHKSLSWVVLAFCPSALLLSVTTHLTQNVAPIPLLWILPLALYLLSFILCFESERWYRRAVFMPLLFVALAAMTVALVDNGRLLGLAMLIPLFCAGLFVVSMVCHGELAASRPPSQALTHFYLMVALGGMLGGVFVGVVAPQLFNGYYELPLTLLFAMALAWRALSADRGSWLNRGRAQPKRGAMVLFAAGLAAGLAYRPIMVGYESRIVSRNFYGVLRTRDWEAQADAKRTLHHGRIIHGMQLLDPARRGWPTTYYGPSSGAGIAMHELNRGPARRVGVIGLGTGTLAAFARSGDYYAFYEIDPHVIHLARTEFFYLADSPARTELFTGDARLVLERQDPQRFDVLFVDAFSGDAVPTHLLTREAFAVYSKHLAPGGLMLINVSNRYLTLAPVVKQSAGAIGFDARVIDSYGDATRVYYGATWVLATPDSQWFSRPLLQRARVIESALPVWTDDYSSIYHVVRW
jgi:hypothetical protein